MPRTCEKCRQLKAEGKIEKAKEPIYGFPGEDGENGKATHCGEHQLPGMENVRSPKCEKCREEVKTGEREKAKMPNFGYPGEDGENGKATHCGEHQLPGMEDVRSPKCEKCREEVKTGEREKATVASFGYPGEKGKPRRCAQHQLPGMEDVVSPKCEVCREAGEEKRALFAMPMPDERPCRCGKHKEEGMVNVSGTECSVCKRKGPAWGHLQKPLRPQPGHQYSDAYPLFARGKPRYCGECCKGKPGVVNVSKAQLEWSVRQIEWKLEQVQDALRKTATTAPDVQAAAKTTAAYINGEVVPALPFSAMAVCLMTSLRVHAETGRTSMSGGYFVNTAGEVAKLTLGEALKFHGAKQIVLGWFDTAEKANTCEKLVQQLTEEKLAPPKTVAPGHRPPAHRITRGIGMGGTSAPVNVPDAVARACVQYVVAMFIFPEGLPQGFGFVDKDKDRDLAKQRAIANNVPKVGGVTVPYPPVQMLAESKVMSRTMDGTHVPVPRPAVSDEWRKRLQGATEAMQKRIRLWSLLSCRVAANKRAEGETLTEKEEALLRQEDGNEHEIAVIEQQMGVADDEEEEDTDEGGSTDGPADAAPRAPVRSSGAAKSPPSRAKRKAGGGPASGVERGRGKQRGARGGGGGVQRSVTDFFARAGKPDAA